MRVSLPDRVLIPLEPGKVLPPHHPAHGKTMIGGRPTAYICQGQSCGPPHTEADVLAAALVMHRT